MEDAVLLATVGIPSSEEATAEASEPEVRRLITIRCLDLTQILKDDAPGPDPPHEVGPVSDAPQDDVSSVYYFSSVA